VCAEKLLYLGTRMDNRRSDDTEDAIGIDLGTTNSVVAHMRGEYPGVFPDALGERLAPSVAFLPEGGGTLVSFMWAEACWRPLCNCAAQTLL
jgi:hypothetical protein